ncbi:MAG: RecX family transcriptional regulator [Aquidulcibacter sp.]
MRDDSETETGGDPTPRSRQRPPRPERPINVSAERLWAVSLRYLQRFSASVEMLRRVLDRRLRPALLAEVISPEEAVQRRESVLQRAASLGYLDDARFTEGRVAALLRQGKSPRVITETLRGKGIAPAAVSAVLAATAAEAEEDIALTAARAFARRRRLGPYRSRPTDDPRQSEKDLASLLRAGHSLTVARQIVTAPGDLDE